MKTESPIYTIFRIYVSSYKHKDKKAWLIKKILYNWILICIVKTLAKKECFWWIHEKFIYKNSRFFFVQTCFLSAGYHSTSFHTSSKNTSKLLTVVFYSFLAPNEHNLIRNNKRIPRNVKRRHKYIKYSSLSDWCHHT